MRRIHRTTALTIFSVLLLSTIVSGHFSRLRGAELFMFEHAGCPWCLMWHREIGPIYSKTEEGKRAPLRRIMLSKDMPPDIAFAEPVVASPTFVLVENGREIGRLLGYRDEASFWGLLGVLLEKLPNEEQGAHRRFQ